jgi:hypothetical protein
VQYAVGADFGTWFSAGSFKVTLGLLADHLSGTMLLVITGVGFLIHRVLDRVHELTTPRTGGSSRT